MGANTSKKKIPKKQDNYELPNEGQKFAEEIDENAGKEISANAEEQKMISESNRDPGTEDYKEHISRFENEFSKDNRVGLDDLETESCKTKGILCSKKHDCNVETDDAKGEEVNSNNEEDLDTENSDDHKNKLEKISQTQSDTSTTASTKENSSKDKSSRHVQWSNKVTLKSEDGLISEEEPRSCDSCKSFIKHDIHIRKHKVSFSKSDQENSKDQDSSSADKGEETTRELIICDSCDLEKSKKAVKKEEQ